MHDVKPAAFAALNHVKNLLIDVGVLLERATLDTLPEYVPEMDLKLRESWQQADRCRRLFLIFREPHYAPYDPVDVLRRHSGECRIKLDPALPAKSRSCLGDSEQILECIRLLRDNVSLDRSGTLRTEIVSEVEAPRVLVSLEGVGTLPAALEFEGLYRVELEEWGRRWTAATQGGHLTATSRSVLFYLEGDREIPPSLETLDAPLAAVSGLARRLSSWRGAIGHFEPGMVSGAEIQILYRETVAACIQHIDRALGNIRFRVRKPV